MAAQYAFVMKDMTKSFPGAQKPVLNHINLQFYHGAKIGIVGPNGAGKSTLMKIMAGIDKDFQGEAWPGENVTVGYLAQEPQLDPTKNVLENVKDGAREVADMVDRFNAISAEMGDPKEDADFDAQMAAAKKLRAKFQTGQEAVKALSDISSDAVKKKTFVLCADIAMSSSQAHSTTISQTSITECGLRTKSTASAARQRHQIDDTTTIIVVV